MPCISEIAQTIFIHTHTHTHTHMLFRNVHEAGKTPAERDSSERDASHLINMCFFDRFYIVGVGCLYLRCMLYFVPNQSDALRLISRAYTRCLSRCVIYLLCRRSAHFSNVKRARKVELARLRHGGISRSGGNYTQYTLISRHDESILNDVNLSKTYLGSVWMVISDLFIKWNVQIWVYFCTRVFWIIRHPWSHISVRNSIAVQL